MYKRPHALKNIKMLKICERNFKNSFMQKYAGLLKKSAKRNFAANPEESVV